MMGINMLDEVRSFLNSNYMYVDEEWLQGCVEYLGGNNGISLSKVKNLAKEQWLLNDLKEICPGSLPAELAAMTKVTLTEKYILQINAALDIGTPAYQQYYQLMKVNMENVEATNKHDEKVPSHRMIKLYLTDGVQEITGIEYKPMRNLNCNITPGTKLLLKGPVQCRKGVLLLTESCVELFEGNNADVAPSNSLAALLSAKLGLPLVEDASQNALLNHQGNVDVPTPHPTAPSMPQSVQELRPTRPTSTVDVIEIDDDDDFDHLVSNIQVRDPIKRPSQGGNENSEKRLKVEAAWTETDELDLTLEDEELLREFDEPIANEPDTSPVIVSSEPFVYIKQINDLCDAVKTGKVFKVKAHIIRLLSRLSVGADGWRLKCTITDGTGNLDVDFGSDLVSKIVGHSPQEMMKLKKQMATNQQVKEKVQMDLQKAKEQLQVLYCIIEITMLQMPTITNLIPFDASHVYLLKERMKNT